MEKQEYILPIATGEVRDPNTGKEGSFYAIYPLLDLEFAVFDKTRETLEQKREFNEAENADDKSKHKSKFILKGMGLVFEAMNHWYEPAQFTVIGELGAYAIQVSYDRHNETPPEQHFHLNQIVSEIAGEDYVTIKRTVYKTKTKE